MARKFICLIALLLFLVPCCYAQWLVSAAVGVSYNHLLTNIDNRISQGINQRYDPAPGLIGELGLQRRWRISRRSAIGLASGITYLQKAYKLDRTDNQTAYYQCTRADYLQLPLLVSYHFTIGSQFTLFVSGGGYAAWWLQGRIRGAVPSMFDPGINRYNELYTFNDKRDNRHEYGWTAGGGIRYGTGRWQPFTAFSCYQSLSDQQKQYMLRQVPRYNRTFVFAAGVAMKL